MDEYNGPAWDLIGPARKKLAIPSRGTSIREYFITRRDEHEDKANTYNGLISLLNENPQIVTALEYIRSL